MIRELAKKLSTFVAFAEGVPAELEFRRGVFTPAAQVVKVHSSMALLRVRSSQAELLVKLIRPRCEIQAALGCRIQSSEKIWRVFTPSEVAEFTAAVGDRNKIHHLNPPIVPGLLILETLCEKFSSCRVLKLKFKNFVTAGEPLTLRELGARFEICSAGERKILLTVA